MRTEPTPQETAERLVTIVVEDIHVLADETFNTISLTIAARRNGIDGRILQDGFSQLQRNSWIRPGRRDGFWFLTREGYTAASVNQPPVESNPAGSSNVASRTLKWTIAGVLVVILFGVPGWLTYIGVIPWWTHDKQPPSPNSAATTVVPTPKTEIHSGVESQNQSGGITAQTVNITNASPPASTPAPRPEVAIRFQDPDLPTLVLLNTSGVVAQNIKWWVLLFNIDRYTPGSLPIAPIRSSTFDFLRAHAPSIPQSLSAEPGFFNIVKPGDRLYGSAIVDCPECKRSRTYFVYLKWGESGWYSLDKNAPQGQVQRPGSQSAQDTAAFVRLVESVPPSARVAVTRPP
jgi:hypothetical protein